MDAITALDALRLGVGALLAAIGLVFIGGGAIGLLRFPDFYTRIHAATAASGVGAIFVVAGLAVTVWDLAIALRLALLGAFIAVLNPTLAHLVASAAHAAGLAPLAGSYTAPRPGAPKRADPRS